MTPPTPDEGAGACPAPCTGAAGEGARVWACPLGLVIVTTFVVLFTTTVL
jgi:hypothetical protein